MQLADIIIQQIRATGPISFHDFMEMALYYPDKGYYTSAGEQIGPNGDFYTSCNLTSLYGAMIGKQIEEMWDNLGQKAFTVVEYGAGTGMLCNDILAQLKTNKKLYDGLQYCIVEKSASMRQKEQSIKCDKVSWVESIDSLGGISGCVLSNELADNFAVHKVIMGDELMEVFVDYDNGFIELLQPAAAQLVNYFDELGVVLPKGYCTEVNLEATQWISEVATSLQEGYVITVDYGFPSAELYSDKRREGTLVCYHKHTVNFDPYINIGYQDITTHINFSALAHWGNINGLECTGYTNQAHFLLGLGIREHLTAQLLSDINNAYSSYKKNTFIMQHLLNEMGRKFKVLIQHKNVFNTPLSGLKLAGPNSATELQAAFSHSA